MASENKLPQSAEASDHLPLLNAMVNWLLKIKKHYEFEFKKNPYNTGELYFAHVTLHLRELWCAEQTLTPNLKACKLTLYILC